MNPVYQLPVSWRARVPFFREWRSRENMPRQCGHLRYSGCCHRYPARAGRRGKGFFLDFSRRPRGRARQLSKQPPACPHSPSAASCLHRVAFNSRRTAAIGIVQVSPRKCPVPVNHDLEGRRSLEFQQKTILVSARGSWGLVPTCSKTDHSKLKRTLQEISIAKVGD